VALAAVLAAAAAIGSCTVFAQPAPVPTQAPPPAPGARIGGAAWVRPGSRPLALIAFTETGLRPGRSVTLVATADALAGYDCLTADGKLLRRSFPITAQVAAVRQYTADTAGMVRGALALAPPPAAGFTCPVGSSPYAVTGLYTNGQVSDVSDRVQVMVAGSFGLPPGVQDR